MKQYTTPEQTAKLIELGFKKPRVAMPKFEWKDGEPQFHYTIGELIEMLPEAICQSNDEDTHYFLNIKTDSCLWEVSYEDECEDVPCATFGVNLIDALYDMAKIFKEKRMI